MVAEHTWGVDIKSYLRDEAAWDRPAFEAARRSDARFTYSEASWTEQRAYLDTAIAELDTHDLALAKERLTERESSARSDDDLAGWQVECDPVSGDIVTISTPDGAILRGSEGSLLGVRYESYDARDVATHMDSYLTHREEWAVLDHGKPGLDRATTARSQRFKPYNENGILTFDPEAHQQLGAPGRIDLRFRPLDAHRIEVAVILHDKPANRMPEATFVTFTPAGNAGWEFLKMGLWQPADRVATHGGGQLQAVAAVRAGTVEIRPLDTPLVAPAATPFMPFNAAPPDFSEGIRFNLHNNKWGTNFPMWWEADRFVARFIIDMQGLPPVRM